MPVGYHIDSDTAEPTRPEDLYAAYCAALDAVETCRLETLDLRALLVRALDALNQDAETVLADDIRRALFR